MQKFLRFALCIIVLVSCRGKKETTYYWEGQDESRLLTLLKDNTFILSIDAGYYQRIDTGTFLMKGDTLILNPDKTGNAIDSLAILDELFEGSRFVHVFEEEVVADTANRITATSYREKIFPLVVVNDSDTLALHPDDATFQMLLIPDSLHVQKMTIIVNEENTCKPFWTAEVSITDENSDSKSYAIYLNSKRNRENYLAGFKWLIKGDTVESFFNNDDCDPTEIKMVRK